MSAIHNIKPPKILLNLPTGLRLYFSVYGSRGVKLPCLNVHFWALGLFEIFFFYLPLGWSLEGRMRIFWGSSHTV